MADINQVQLPDGSQYNIKDDISGYATETYVQNQISGITKATIGLGNVDNTSDANKPVSTAQQTALDGKTNTSMVAYVETSTTATKRYEIGDQFILNGVLYTATAIIANGGTITVGTNCTASDTVIEQVESLEDSANINYDNTASGLTATKVKAAIDEVVGMTKHGIVELWTNSSPASNFAGQTINITQTDLDNRGLKVNINDIDAVDVEFEISEISVLTIRGRIGARIQPTYTAMGISNGKVSMSLRQVSISRANNTISLAITDCTNYEIGTYGTTPSSATTNNQLVPTIITGLIHNS